LEWLKSKLRCQRASASPALLRQARRRLISQFDVETGKNRKTEELIVL